MSIKNRLAKLERSAPENRAWMLDRLGEGGNWNAGRNMFLGLIDGAALPLADVIAGRNELAKAALTGCADSAYALGRAWAGPVGCDTGHALYWLTRAAGLGSRDALYSSALCAAHIAWYERRDDPKATERALGLIWLARDEWPEYPQAEVLDRLRVDMLTLWPELEAWEFDASCDQWQAVHGADH